MEIISGIIVIAICYAMYHPWW